VLLAFWIIAIMVIAWSQRTEADRALPGCHFQTVSPEKREALRRKFQGGKRTHHRRLTPGRHLSAHGGR
jgi:hypothetical protein